MRPPYRLEPYQTLVIPPPATYRVRAGDSVAGIATTLGVDEVALARANGLSEPYHMRVGQVLKVPGGVGDEGAPAASSPPPSSEEGFTGVEPPPRSSITAQPLTPPPAYAPPPNSSPYPPPSSSPISPPPSSSATALAPPEPRPPQAANGPHPAKPPETASAAPERIVPPPPSAPSQPSPKPDAPPPPGQREPAVREPVPAEVAAAGTPAGAPHFTRPVAGKLIAGFGVEADGTTNDGLNIAAAAGTPVHASEGGTVIYTGNELQAFGNLVLIRHAGGWVTAYGHLATIAVQSKASVTQGQVIGTVGQTGTASSPQLHFEIRQGSKPVDPAPLLGAKG